jgi:3-oxoacyl-[acyl-carrier-protein] synthase-3
MAARLLAEGEAADLWALSAVSLHEEIVMGHEAYISSIASFLPNEAVKNDDMEKVLGQVGSRPSRARSVILRSNRIASRHYAIDPQTRKMTHTNAQLAAEAVRRLSDDLHHIDDIDLLVCGSSVPDQLLPNIASMVHGELGIPSCETVGTAGVCMAGTMSLKFAYLSVLSGQSRNAVATASENISAILRAETFQGELDEKIHQLKLNPIIAFEKDFLRWMLSDGAGAAWIEKAPCRDRMSLRIDWIFQKSYANEMPVCMYAGAEKMDDGTLKSWKEHEPKQWLDRTIFSIRQDVKLLNEAIITYTATRPLRELVECGRLKPQNIDWFVPHYSSGYFRERLYEAARDANCEIPYEKWFTNLYTKGNTASASIYIMLDEMFHSGLLKSGDAILCYVPESGRFSTAFMHLTVV